MRGLARRAWLWVRAHPSAIAILILAVMGVASLEIDRRQEIEDRREDRREAAEEREQARTEQIELFVHEAQRDCRTGNETRALIRTIGVDLAVEAARGPAEALIEVVPDADPETVEAFRRGTVEQARSRAEALVADLLPPLDCLEAARVARADIESRLDGE